MRQNTQKLNIIRLSTAAEALAAAGESLSGLLSDNRETPVLLLLSGGSALKILDFLDEETLGGKLTIAVLDERFSSDPAVNNFAQLQDTDFYMQALISDASFIGTLPRSGDTKESLAQRLEAALRSWKAENPGGVIIATLGMGTDGHTAGILPFPEDPGLFKKLFDGEKWITAYDAGNKNPFRERITATLPLLRMIDKAIGFISGPEKKPALDRLMLKRDTIERLPAMSFRDIKELQIFTDIH